MKALNKEIMVLLDEDEAKMLRLMQHMLELSGAQNIMPLSIGLPNVKKTRVVKEGTICDIKYQDTFLSKCLFTYLRCMVVIHLNFVILVIRPNKLVMYSEIVTIKLMIVPTSCGAIYFLTIAYNFSCVVWVYILLEKREVAQTIKNFCAMIEHQLKKQVKIVKSDNGTEFTCLRSYFELHDITSCVGTLQKNGSMKESINIS
ncbi:hypothetical protein CR513_32039, partial [Mucuna pruriens]